MSEDDVIWIWNSEEMSQMYVLRRFARRAGFFFLDFLKVRNHWVTVILGHQFSNLIPQLNVKYLNLIFEKIQARKQAKKNSFIFLFTIIN